MTGTHEPGLLSNDRITAIPHHRNTRSGNRPYSDRVRSALADPACPSKMDLARWVLVDNLTDDQIAKRHIPSKGGWWVKLVRAGLGISRPVGGNENVGEGAERTPVLPTGDEEEVWDKVRHGELTLDDLEFELESSPQEIRWSYKEWLASIGARPLESRAMRHARYILTDPDSSNADRIIAVLGRRVRFDRRSGVAIMDGQAVQFEEAANEANEEAAFLGLPSPFPRLGERR